MSKHFPILTPKEAIRLAAIRAGSQHKLASFLHVSQASISTWDKLPAELVLKVEAAFGVSRQWLRPDLYSTEIPSCGRFIGVDQEVDRVAFNRRGISKRAAAA